MLVAAYLLVTVSLGGHLANANIAVISPSSTSASSNLTCEEFCAISLHQIDDDEVQSPREVVFGDRDSGAKRSAAEWMRRKEFRSLMNVEYLRGSSLIFGLAQQANEEYLSGSCYKQLKDIEKGVLRKDVWAMKVLDSSGSKESGFLWGHNYWLGSQDGCEALQNPVYITLSDQYERAMKKGLINDLAPFEMEYRVIYLKHNSPWQVEIKFMTERIIHIGLCLPKVCSTSEVYNMTQSFLDQGVFEEGNMYDVHPEVIHIKDLKLNANFLNKKSLKIVGAFLAFTLAMVIIATCMEISTDDKRISWQEQPTSTISTIIDSDTSETRKKQDPLTWYPYPYEKSFIHKFIKCFDLVENCRSLFTFKESTADTIPVINGLRSVSCIWIMLFHVVWYMYFTVDNKTFLISYGERVFFQYVSTAPLLVDVFFTISGFLVTYNFIKNESNFKRIRESSLTDNLKAFGKMILHRYLRLGPLYLVLTGMVEIFTAYIEDVSIFHIHERYDQTCTKYWWRNIFFIQNLFHQEELCLNWTWSLACEMQFYILAIGLLFFYARYPKQTKRVFTIGLMSSILWTYFVGYTNKYQLSFDVAYHTGTQIYINPFVRVMPYFMGIGCGWLVAKKKFKMRINSTVEKCLWNVAILIFFACIYSTVKRDMSIISTISLLVLGRLSFSLAVCWMIIGSATGRGVWWSRFLEWKVFQHLNKLSYAIYLLNPFVIAIVFSLSNSSTHADPILLCVLTSGFIVIVYICSIVFSLSFEIPYCKLSSVLLKRKAKVT